MHGAAVRAGRYSFLKPLQREVSDYLRENVWVTSCGTIVEAYDERALYEVV